MDRAEEEAQKVIDEVAGEGADSISFNETVQCLMTHLGMSEEAAIQQLNHAIVTGELTPTDWIGDN